MNGHQSLYEFMLDAFDGIGLRIFLAGLPHGDELLRQLPGDPVSLKERMFAAVELLRRHGLLDRDFFQRLALERPARRAEIERIAASFGSTARLPPQPPPSAPTTAAERPALVLVRAGDGLVAAERLQRDLERLLPGLDVHILRVSEWSPEIAGPPTAACAVLFTRELMQSPALTPLLRELRELHQLGALRVMPVLVTPTRWRTGPLGRLTPLPANGVAVEEARDAETAWAEILLGLVRNVQRPSVPPGLTDIAAADVSFPDDEKRTTPSPTRSAAPVALPAVQRRVEDVFRTTGVPDVNFVAPAQLEDLTIRVRFMGEGLVIEGPSGIGKTTATSHALTRHLGGTIDVLRRDGRLSWLSSKDDADLATLRATLDAGHKQLRGYLVLDDFHHLPAPLQRRVADLVKLLADSGSAAAKVILIGINPVGASLVQHFPDVAGRFAAIAMNKQPDAKIEELIALGERALNIAFERRSDFVQAARGSFFTAQLLCREAAIRESVLETVDVRRTLINGPDGVVLDKVLSQLRFKYHDLLRIFASYDRQPPPRGACLALLWMLATAVDATVSLATARTRYPHLADGLDWLLTSNLSALFAREPRLGQLLFYNRDAAVLSAEDPQLDFYLHNLHWPALARDSGHTDVDWDPERGFQPVAPRPSIQPTQPPSRSTTPAQPLARVLHISDLHLDSQQHAVLWYGQLLADLRTEMGIDRLDAVVVSGDLSNRATAQEFDAAAQFLRDLQDDFKLSPHRLILVPGNHDLNWTLSKKSYRVVRREEATELIAGRYIDKGDYVELPDDLGHRARFQPFADFYYAVRGEPYPLDHEYQATIHHFADARLLILGLNSAWALDHHYRDRADINAVALGHALRRIQLEPGYADCLKIAVWHHPVNSPDDDRIRDTGFIERLAQAGFRFGLHGHIHKPQQGLFRYDMTTNGRRIDFIGAGTFGAPVHEWQPGHPLQYQLLTVDGTKLRVESRRREELNGAWKPDARFTQGRALPPSASYEIDL